MRNDSGDPFGIESMMETWTQSMGDIMTAMPKMWPGIQPPPKSTGEPRFENLDDGFFQTWAEIYEKDFQKFFHLPQIGMAREYQERINQMMDKFNLFQASHAEFSRMLSLPFQKALQEMQAKIAELAGTGELPEDSNAYYQMWIKTLEGHFMTLFQTPEYIKVLSKTISTLSGFSKTKNAVIEDMIKGLPVARQSEVDDLAREVFELKKRVKNLEKMNRLPKLTGEVE